MSFEELVRTAKQAIIARDPQLDEKRIQLLWTGSAMNVLKVCCYAAGNLYIVTMDSLTGAVSCEKYVRAEENQEET